MDCRSFRQLHGDWADDVLDPTNAERLARHTVACESCARFDSLARRALLVARNAPAIEVSADFSARLAARIAEERRHRIAEHKPSHAERPSFPGAGTMLWTRRAATVALLVGGTMFARTLFGGPAVTATLSGADAATLTGFDGFSDPGMFTPSADSRTPTRGLVVVRAMRPMGGALLPFSDDPLLDGADRASMGEVTATTVAATAPLWPTAMMATHAAKRFAAMEFGDVTPVSATQINP